MPFCMLARVPVGFEALEVFRIASGVPAFGQDIRERDLPQETEQKHALHFVKGCYIGQEIVERIRSRGNVHRGLIGFTLAAIARRPPSFPKDGKDVGEITSVAQLPSESSSRWATFDVKRERQAPC